MEEPHPHTGRMESEDERVDRNLLELVGELRLALPGVQVLFAFLLVVPFNAGFAKVTDFQETLYLATLLCSAGASMCLIAPSVHHRIMFRRRDREHLVVTSNRAAIVGLTLLAVAMTSAVVLVTDVLFGTATTIVVGVLVAGGFAGLWYGLPLRRRADLAR